MKRAWLVMFLIAPACGDNASATVDAAHHPIDAAIDSPPDSTDVTHQTITLAGPANGLVWDDAGKILYFTDSNAKKLMAFTDAGGVQTLTDLPAEAAGVSPGGLAVLGASLITPNIHVGDSPANNLFIVDPIGQHTKATTGLATANHRTAVAVSQGVLYDAYFTGTAGTASGFVATVAVNQTTGVAAEVPFVFATDPGFGDLVGLAADADSLFVADATQNKVFKVVITTKVVTTVGSVPDADLMSMMPNGDLIVGGTGVHRLTQAGAESELFGTENFGSIRGSAYDPTGKRLFFINDMKLEIRPLAN